MCLLFHKWEHSYINSQHQRKCLKCSKTEYNIGNSWCLVGVHDYKKDGLCQVCGTPKK